MFFRRFFLFDRSQQPEILNSNAILGENWDGFGNAVGVGVTLIKGSP